MRFCVKTEQKQVIVFVMEFFFAQGNFSSCFVCLVKYRPVSNAFETNPVLQPQNKQVLMFSYGIERFYFGTRISELCISFML